MARGWPALFPPEGPIWPDDPDRDLTGGHPTAPGDLDAKPIRNQGQPSPGSGIPSGRPRYRSMGTRHGPGIPGTTPTGPMSPGVDYDDGNVV